MSEIPSLAATTLKCPECGTELRVFCSFRGFEYYAAKIDIWGKVVGDLLDEDRDEWKAQTFQCPKCEWEERFPAHLWAIAESKERGNDEG